MKTTKEFMSFTIFAGILSMGSGVLAQPILAFAPLLSTEKEISIESKQNLNFCTDSKVQYKRTISVGSDPTLIGQVLSFSTIEATYGSKTVTCFYEPVEIDSVSSNTMNDRNSLNVVAKADQWLYIPYLGTGLDMAVRKNFDEQFDVLIRKSLKKVAIKDFKDFNLYKVSTRVSPGNQASTVTTDQYLYTFPSCEISKVDHPASARIQRYDAELNAQISYPKILTAQLKKYFVSTDLQDDGQAVELNKIVQQLKETKSESNVIAACETSFQQNFYLQLARQAELIRQLQIDDANTVRSSHEKLIKAETDYSMMLNLILKWN